MRRLAIALILFLFAISLAQVPAAAQDLPAISAPYVPPEIPDSLAGLQTQVDELVRVAKARDQANWQVALGTFSLPNPSAWFLANFAPEHRAKLTEDYPRVRDGHLGHISWVIGHNQDAPNFRIRVELSEMPSPPSDMGFESLLPRPLSEVHLQNFRFTPAADSGSMPPSWVSSLVFVEGHFRMIGGTYPFWAEKLTPIRGPMSLPPATIRGMTVQGMAYQHDQRGRTNNRNCSVGGQGRT